MLLSIISSSAISSTVISMVTTPGLPQYGSAVVVGLIALLSLKEVLSASSHWNGRLNNSFNLPIIPLLLSFACIVIFKVAEIIWDLFLLLFFFFFEILLSRFEKSFLSIISCQFIEEKFPFYFFCSPFQEWFFWLWLIFD